MNRHVYKALNILAHGYYKTIVAVEYRWFRIFGPTIQGVHPRYQVYAHRHARKMRKLVNQMVKYLGKRTKNRAQFKMAVSIYNWQWKQYCDNQLNKYRNLAPDPKGFKRFVDEHEKAIKKITCKK